MAHRRPERTPEEQHEIRSAAAKKLWDNPDYRARHEASRDAMIKRVKETKFRRQLAESVAKAWAVRDNAEAENR